MFFPVLNGLLRFKSVPVTWLLFLSQAFIFFLTLQPSVQLQKQIDQLLKDDAFVRTQGQLFAQYVLDQPGRHSSMLHKMAQGIIQGEGDSLKLFGSMALRDQEFLADARTYPFAGDRVKINHWRDQLTRLLAMQEGHPSFALGLTAENQGVFRWFSYIFAHSGVSHFIGNMFFLLIFGSMLEPVMGGVGLLISFLLSGAVAAVTFLVLSGATAAPLIGASGAVSGLMVLFALYYGREPVKYFYALLPSVKYVGLVYLPAWLVVVMFVASDLAGYWGTLPDFGGVAYTAHIGGEAAGALMGLIMYALRGGQVRVKPAMEITPVMGRPISFFEMAQGYEADRPRSLAEIRSKSPAHRVLGHHSRLHKLK